MSLRQAFREREVYLAAGNGRNRLSEPCATVDAFGRHRLALSAEDLDACDCCVSDKCDSPVFMQVSYQFSSYLHGILRSWIALRCRI